MLLIKKLSYLAMPLALSLGATSCINDTFVDDVEPVGPTAPTGGTDCRFAFSLEQVGARASRAANNGDPFEDGEKDEWEIGDGRNYVLFFRQSDGSFFDCKPLTLTLNQMPEADNITVEYEAKLKIEEEYLENNPLQCMIFVNSQHLYNSYFSSLTSANKLSDVVGLLWSETDPTAIGRDDNGLFTMCNSIFVQSDGNLRVTVPVTSDNLIIDDGDHFYTQEELDRKTVVVQVERMMAKFTFRMPEDAGSYSNFSSFDGTSVFTPVDNQILYCNSFDITGKPIYETREWKADVKGWGVNALERQGSVVKNVDANGGYFSGWNEPQNWRCNWAIDQHYFTSDYPQQFRPAVDAPDINYYKNERDGKGNYLKNYSYNDLCNADFNRAVYVPENTYNSKSVGNIDNRSEVLAGTHLIICAELLTNIPDKGSFTVNDDLYRDYQGVFYQKAKNCFWVLTRRFIMDLQSQTTMKYYLYDWDDQETLPTGVPYEALTAQAKSPENPNGKGEYKLYLNGEELTYQKVMSLKDDQILFISANIDGGDGRVIPWIDGLSIRRKNPYTGIFQDLAIYTEVKQRLTPEAEKDEEKTGECYYDWSTQKENIKNFVRYAKTNDLKSLFLEWLGPVDHYSGSKMYYAAPAKMTDDVFGVVRNNWYSFYLTSINKIGTSIDIPSQPIVPDEVVTKNRVNVNVDILDWHSFTFTAPLL